MFAVKGLTSATQSAFLMDVGCCDMYANRYTIGKKLPTQEKAQTVRR